MRITKAKVAGGLVLAAGMGAVAVAAGAAISLRRWRDEPDPAAGDDFSEPPGTTHHTFATGDGGRIHVVERGAGRPFLLVHGVTNSTQVWTYQFRDLVDAGFRVVAMDVRGHGRSEAGTDGYSIAAMADDAYHVIRRLELRDAIAVGHSMGGMIVLQLVADHPELMAEGAVTGLALVATSAMPVLGGSAPQAIMRLGRALTPAVGRGFCRAVGPFTADAAGGAGSADSVAVPAAGETEAVPAGGTASGGPVAVPPPASAALRWIFGAHPSLTLVEQARAMSCTVPPEIVDQLFLSLLELDVRASLGAIRQPVLIVVGTRDPLTPVWHARYLARHIPVSELHVLAGSGHVVPFERRAELARLLTDFAARSQPVAAAVAAPQ